MLYNPHNNETCKECQSPKDFFKPCRNCENVEKLKGLVCPCCKGLEIILVQRFNDNGIYGPGAASWVVSEKFACKTCGVLFLDPKKLK